MNKVDFYRLMQSVPKAEIHLHGEAVISGNTIKTIYKTRYQKNLSDDEFEDIFNYNDLSGFIASFLKIQGFFKNIEDISLIFSDFEKYLVDNNITYCETFFSPTALLKNGFDFNELVSRISAAIEGTARKGITVKIIVDVSRGFGTENAMSNLKHVLETGCPYIIGIGLGGDEKKGPARDFEKVFLEAEKHNLHRVVHAGETCDSWSIKDALNLLHAERIGHGISAAYDEECIKELADKNIALEICPTSNIYTKHYFRRIKDSPAKKLFDSGVPVTINSDDPTFFKASLIDEFWNAYSQLGFSLEEIRKLIKNGFSYSFLPEDEKKQKCREVDESWDRWFKENPSAKK